ncbi:hypothetical protein FOH10_13175 [Nocardia otitidiscaviarum]|uniref:Uncharacterized protein n=1 Tax=Nocardia otitidiscaviarum TaxID=1823 RepID=A0A516NKS9_9NOCA|nr:hypothetical protein [Nocardia otitidiscaviarum]MCP9618835.1 hypothetical protein [Nocardia otitidiscaviarum]QDP79518.1 hypothetical protein FOH10_13175 [Nocardia otitidiscaviarum]
MADPLDELRVLKTQLRALRWMTQVDSLMTLARASARGPGARGGISKATIGNIINPDNPTMPRWETYEIFVDTCLRLIDQAGVEPPADGADRRIWRQRYIRVRDALGDNDATNGAGDGPAGAGVPTPVEPGAALPDSDHGPEVTSHRPRRGPLRLAAAAVLAVVAAVVGWQQVTREPGSRGAQPVSAPSFCSELSGRMILEEGFDDSDADWPHHPGRTEYAAGSYRLTALSGTQTVYADVPVPSSTDACAEAVVRRESGSGGFGLTCRGEPEPAGRRYLFSVSSTGHWGISMVLPAESRVAVLASRDHLPGLDLNLDTRIGASCRTTDYGTELMVSVNGDRIRYLDPQSQLTGGRLGVAGWTWLMEPGSSSSFLIEEIRIWELS